MKTPEKVTAALLHVQQHLPQVVQVVYLRDGRWRYMDEEGEAPSFAGKAISVRLLEDAADAVSNRFGFPAAFSLPEDA